MNRATALTYAGGLYAAQLTAAGVDAADTTGHLKEPLDDALRALGYSEAQLATADTTTAELPAHRTVLRWLALEKIYLNLITKVDITIGQDSKKYSQMAERVEKLLSRARSDAAIYVETDGAFGMAWLILDIYEPVQI